MHRLSRRRFLGTSAMAAGAIVGGGILSACGSDSTATPVSTSSTLPPVTSSEEALSRLMDGNARFVSDRAINVGRDSVRRAELAETQAPLAIIVGCSDSRVPPEILFDQGLGDLFLVRVAGNTAADPLLIGSIEYAVAVLGSVLLMVLGHQNCGAVKATLKNLTQGETPPGDIPAVLQPIIPAAKAVLSQPADSQLEAAIETNVRMQAQGLESSGAIIEPAIRSGKLKVVGGEYMVSTGEVKLIY